MGRNYEEIIRYSKENNDITKRALKDGLIKLLHMQEFDTITVSKLCEVAGVSRMSFYRNYSIIHDIFNELAVDLNLEIIDAVGSPFRNGIDKNWYIKTFEIIKAKKSDFLLLSQKQFQEEWMRVVNSLANHSQDFSKEKYYQRLMWCGGFENVASNWVNNGIKESVEEISSYCVKYLPHLVKEDNNA